jgi:ABC-type transport system involved in cytochrome bd biosynthesis fused ATPase/permease subunit
MFIRSILEVVDVAILDEPFASLDMDMKKIIKNMFVDFKNLKKTVIYTTNRKIDTDIADNILELNNERRDNLLGEKGSSG